MPLITDEQVVLDLTGADRHEATRALAERLVASGRCTDLDTFLTDPISDLAVTTDGFERCGALVAELGLPTVVLQEGGYDVSALGENVRRWLVGLRCS